MWGGRYELDYKRSAMTKDENVRQERTRSDSYGRFMVLCSVENVFESGVV